jgi:hypothetical protein
MRGMARIDLENRIGSGEIAATLPLAQVQWSGVTLCGEITASILLK